MDGGVERVHATAIAVGQRAVLIRGPSGSGKSDLAFRCMGIPASEFVPSPARLVADDQVLLTRDGLALKAAAPPALLGKLEVRGLGILAFDPIQNASVVMVATIVDEGQIERYPDVWPKATFLGLDVPVLRIAPFESSAPLKVLAALGMPMLPPVSVRF